MFTQFSSGPRTNGMPKQPEQDYQVMSNNTYQVTFSVKIKLERGQSLGIVGSIPELGSWNPNMIQCFMRWTEGDLWVIEKPLVTSVQFITYKYVVLKNKTSLVRWEKGINRIADFEVMEDAQGTAAYDLAGGSNAVKRLEQRDEWESYYINFSINNSQEAGTDEVLLQENESTSGFQTHFLQKRTVDTNWSHLKYGREIRPWFTEIKVANDQHGIHGPYADAPNRDIQYRFGKKGPDIHPDDELEREPYRYLRIQSPGTYQGQLGKKKNHYWQENQDDVWIVNGRIYKAAGNLRGKFYIKKMSLNSKSNLYTGAAPSVESHVQTLAENKIAAVMDIQTRSQYQKRGFNDDYFVRLLRQRGINQKINQPVDDSINIDSYANDLFEASKVLDNIINKQNQKVFVHCTTGASRAATLICVYYCLFCRHPEWQYTERVEEFLNTQNIHSHVNMVAVKKVIADNQKFQMEQKKLRDEEERLRKLKEDEEEAARRRKAEQEEAEYLRLKKLLEDEKDKIRQYELKKADFERMKQQWIKEEEDRYEREREKIEEKYRKMLQDLLDDEYDRQKRQGRDPNVLKEEERRRKKADQDLDEARMRIKRLHEEFYREDDQIRSDREDRYHKYRDWREALDRKFDKINRDEIERIEQDDIVRQHRLQELAFRNRQVRIQELRREKIRVEREVDELQDSISRQKDIDRIELKLETRFQYNKKLSEMDEVKRRELLEKQYQQDKINSELMVVQRMKWAKLEEERLALLESHENHNHQFETNMHDDDRYKFMLSLEEEERERIRLRRLAEEEAEFLITKARRGEQTTSSDGHFYRVDDYYSDISLLYKKDQAELGITDRDLDEQCEELFHETPIRFEKRTGSEVEGMIEEFILQNGITIPIQHVVDNLYCVGPQVLQVHIKDAHLYCKVAGKYEMFNQHVLKNIKIYQRYLVVQMMKTNKSLEYVVEQHASKRYTNAQMNDRRKSFFNGQSPLLKRLSQGVQENYGLTQYSATSRNTYSPQRFFGGMNGTARNTSPYRRGATFNKTYLNESTGLSPYLRSKPLY